MINNIENPLVTNYLKSEFIAKEVAEIMGSSTGDYPDLDMVAHAFGISGRTLRRQLSCAGTSFQKILNHIRCQHAMECLKSTKMSTDEIAQNLGFSDASNFSHAFKKWVGTSPSGYRARNAHALSEH